MSSQENGLEPTVVYDCTTLGGTCCAAARGKDASYTNGSIYERAISTLVELISRALNRNSKVVLVAATTFGHLAEIGGGIVRLMKPKRSSIGIVRNCKSRRISLQVADSYRQPPLQRSSSNSSDTSWQATWFPLRSLSYPKSMDRIPRQLKLAPVSA
jgi:hypothetical protein